MKAIAWLTIIWNIKIVLSYRNSSIASFAINAIINEYFVPSSSKIDLIHFGSRYCAEKSVTTLLRNKNDSLSIKVLNNELDPWTNIINTSSILLFNSEKSFKQKVSNITWQSDKSVRHKHIVHYPNATNSDLNDTFMDGFAVDNVVFLLNENEKSIDLVASFMFSPGHCRSNQFKVINRFDKSSMRWENSNFYPNKYENLLGCILDVAIINSTRAVYCQLKISPNGSIEIKGYGYDVILALAQSFNFGINTKIFPSPEAAERNNTSDLSSFLVLVNDFEDSFFITSAYYLFGDFILLIPPGELYTPLEKMFMIFGFEVWILIAVTFLVAFGTVQIINCATIKTQNFVYGRNVNTPTLNIFSTFLIGNQTVIPERNFARFLLILFILWSLIIRTCHQSVLFKYLQQDLRKPEVKTFRELVEHDFTLYDEPAGSSYILGIMDEEVNEKNSLKVIYIENKDFNIFDSVADPDLKRTSTGPDTILYYINNQFRSGFSSLLILEERIFGVCLGQAFPPFSPFYETFKDKIHQMIDAGLTDYWVQNTINPRGFIKKVDEIGPEVLTMDHLDIAFKIIGFALAISFLGFVSEILIACLLKKIRRNRF